MARSPTQAAAHAVLRYAHPYFTTAPGDTAAPASGGLENWSKQQLGPIPAVRHGGLMNLADVIGTAGVTEIQDVGEIRFHALGDTGVGHADEAEKVAEDMATDYKPTAGGLNPGFLLHLGDVIYGPDKATHYGERFYRPYRHYPGKIIAIPGNHDGEIKSAADSPSLSAFQANFCTTEAGVPPQAAGTGIFRQTVTQPGVYWLLEAPFVRIIGLYSNLLENPGYLEGRTNKGESDLSQLHWLADVLSSIAHAPEKKALVVATHHPPYSQSGHSGSVEMSQSIDAICKQADVYPDLFLSAHAHNYQRYTRRIGGKVIPYIVAGTGGMPPQKVEVATGQPASGSNTVTYDRAMASLGYLFVTVTRFQLNVEFWPLGPQHTTPFDSLTVDLTTSRVS